MQKYVVCRPQNGLNDILNQIEICCLYAQRYDRQVIVDTGYRHTMYFKEAFSKYFSSRQQILILDNPLSDEEIDQSDVYPRFLAGRVSSYETDWRRLIEFRLAMRPLVKAGRFVDKASGRPIWFSFNRDYKQRLLVHSQGGGGVLSFDCLGRLQARPWLVDKFEERLSQLPCPYAAVHIRNTDLTTDYASMLMELQRRKLPVLFLASDDSSVVEIFRTSLPATKVVSFTNLQGNSGTPIHKALALKDAPQLNTDTILDLLTLALGSPLLLARTREAESISKLSGFSMLAANLNQNKGALMNLLGGRKSLLGRSVSASGDDLFIT